MNRSQLNSTQSVTLLTAHRMLDTKSSLPLNVVCDWQLSSTSSQLPPQKIRVSSQRRQYHSDFMRQIANPRGADILFAPDDAKLV
jgi:hypothetical protein